MLRSCAALTVLLCLIAAGATAAGPSLTALAVETERVVVFKDGYCMFVKKATGAVDREAKAVIEDVPESMTLGSFWLIPEGASLKSVVARERLIPRHGEHEREKNLEIQFDPRAADARANLTMLHYGPGIRWIPTYRILLGDGGEAHLMMQAELLNEAEDLVEVSLDLVVGVPNFRFSNCVSPMSLVAQLRNPLQAAAPQIMGQQLSNVLFTQRAAEVRRRPEGPDVGAGAAVPALPAELAEGAHDLFVYHVPSLTLAAGERALVPVVSGMVPFRHFYAWDVHLQHAGTEAVPAGGAGRSPVNLLKNEVWHLVELTNESGAPWTTGAAMVMEGFLPLCQELLTYTPRGGKCDLPVTVAVDVRGTYSEKETGREQKAIRLDGTDYARISKKGTLRVTNHKDEDIELIVNCQFGGNATGASDGGRITLTDFVSEDWRDFRGSAALTGHSTVRWELKLERGGTAMLTCDYFYHTR